MKSALTIIGISIVLNLMKGILGFESMVVIAFTVLIYSQIKE